MTDTRLILATREKTHGDYIETAGIAQVLKDAMRCSSNWKQDKLSFSQCESLDLIATKIGRILSGDPHTRDHWDDIAGYAKLIADRL